MLVLNSARDDSVHNPAAFPLAKAPRYYTQRTSRNKGVVCAVDMRAHLETSADPQHPLMKVRAGRGNVSQTFEYNNTHDNRDAVVASRATTSD